MVLGPAGPVPRSLDRDLTVVLDVDCRSQVALLGSYWHARPALTAGKLNVALEADGGVFV